MVQASGFRVGSVGTHEGDIGGYGIDIWVLALGFRLQAAVERIRHI